MSENPSPKPKPGSLRDRIAAFENANKGSAPPPAPAPRPKPSTLQSWKPKVPSPPQSPESERKTSGMSASDAVESIGKGVSLKERMAALQGKGAFGGVVPPPMPPKPTEKPKWKPPPPVSPPVDEAAPTDDAIDAQGSPSLAVGDPDQAKAEGEHDVQQDVPETEQDPEEEERQRRAAIAARMARLGGARVGMGVPMFGGKPVPGKKPETPLAQSKQEEEAATEPAQEVISPPMEALSPPVSIKEEARTDSDYFPIRKDSDSSLLSSASTVAPSRSPSSMPVPAGPRRAAPPRKKAYKSPSATQLSEVSAPAAVPDATEEALEAAPTAEHAAESTLEPAPESVVPPTLIKVTSHETVQSPEQVPVPSSEEILITGDVQKEIREVGRSAELDVPQVYSVDVREGEEEHVGANEPQLKPEQEDQEEEVQEEEDEDEDEEEEEQRRRRVAAKLSQMGGFNPLAGPPPLPRQESIPSPPASARHDSFHTEEPLDVEDEVNVDIEEVGESVPPPPPTYISPQAHQEEPEEAREAEEPASRAAESEDEPLPDLGTTRRVLYYEEESYGDHGSHPGQDLSEPEGEPGLQSATEAHIPEAAVHSLPPPGPIPQEYKYRDNNLMQPGTSVQAPSIDAGDTASYDNALEVLAQERNQDQDDDEMAPARITRPIPPPPVNLSSKPSISLPSSPPPLRTPLYALQADEDRPESPAPRPVPPPVKSVKAAQKAPPSPPPRIARRTSASIRSVDVEVPQTSPPPVPTSPRPPVRSPTSPPTAYVSEEDAQQVKSVEEAPPAPPARIARRTSASIKSVDVEAPQTPPPVPTSPRPPARRPTSPPIITTLPLSSPATTNEEDIEREFLDSETPSQPQRDQEPEEEDEESVRRRTIAERMARLGGIRFGAPPVPTPLTRPTFPRAPPPTSIPPDESEADTKSESVQEETETEEDEEARKQRIAAKLAGMGGMRFGMLPLGAGVAPATARRLASRQDDSENEDAALPVPAPVPPRQPPPPPALEVDSEQEQSQGTSDDGVRVELEESEIEEVHYSDVDSRASVEEEAPPLPPQRRASVRAEALPTPPPRTSRSPPPLGRPPVPSIPTTLLNRRPSVATGSAPSSRQSSVNYSTSSDTPTQKQRAHAAFESVLSGSVTEYQSEYVMVEPESVAEEEPPAPPRRRSLRAPPRSFLPPPPPPSAVDPPEKMVGSAQWELASIPQATSEFGNEGDLGSSAFSEDSTFNGSSPPSTRESKSRRTSGQTAHPADQELNADDLMAIWGKVGVQVVESATGLFDKSKRSLVGDGSYAGFVRATIAQVPNARRVYGDGEDWGYLIYAQTASSVQRRVAEIMPGDVIAFWDAKLKGHKGLHTYSQTVGAGDNGPLLGVVSEVEGKKSKVRVWQANQHVGQQVSLLRRWSRRANGALTPKATQTVENVSYRLEDLKSGNAKVFRVMEE